MRLRLRTRERERKKWKNDLQLQFNCENVIDTYVYEFTSKGVDYRPQNMALKRGIRKVKVKSKMTPNTMAQSSAMSVSLHTLLGTWCHSKQISAYLVRCTLQWMHHKCFKMPQACLIMPVKCKGLLASATELKVVLVKRFFESLWYRMTPVRLCCRQYVANM